MSEAPKRPSRPTPSGAAAFAQGGQAPMYAPRGRAPSDKHAMLMAIAVLLSLLLHTLVALGVYNKPLARIDLNSLQQEDRVFRVKRADADELVADRVPGTSDVQGVIEQNNSDKKELSDLSRALLAAGALEPLDEALKDPQDALLNRDETRPDDPTRGLGGQATGSDALTNDVLAALRTGPPVDLPFAEGGFVPLTKSGGGSLLAGSGSKITPAAEPPAFQGGAETARGLLNNAGFIGATNPEPPPLATPRFAERIDRPVEDKRLVNAPIESPAIDFAAIALKGTTQLDVPEHLDDDFEYELSIYKPGKATGGFFGIGAQKPDQGRYFRVDIRARRSLTKLQTLPKDVVFLIDTSGSVPQDWVTAVVGGVRDGLASLNEGDRFNIVFFNETPAFFSNEGVQPATDQTIAAARAFLKDAKSSGFTDVNRALSRLLVRDLGQQRVYHLVLISDGVPTRGVMDTRELINLVTRDNDLNAGIYCVGVGNKQNRQLLEFLAYRNKGYCLYPQNAAEADVAVRDLMSRLRYPIIKNIRLNMVGLDNAQVFPIDLPTIHQGESFSLFGMYDSPKVFTSRLTGYNGAQPVDFTFTRDLSLAPEGSQELPQQWAFWKLHHLYSELIRKGDTPAIRKAIEEIRDRYKLKTLY